MRAAEVPRLYFYDFLDTRAAPERAGDATRLQTPESRRTRTGREIARNRSWSMVTIEVESLGYDGAADMGQM